MSLKESSPASWRTTHFRLSLNPEGQGGQIEAPTSIKKWISFQEKFGQCSFDVFRYCEGKYQEYFTNSQQTQKPWELLGFHTWVSQELEINLQELLPVSELIEQS